MTRSVPPARRSVLFVGAIVHALRGLLRARAFALTAVAMLAVAIGLNVTAFVVMDTMLFRGFPLVRDNDRLLYLQERFPLGGCCLQYPDYLEWRAQARSFEDLAFVSGRVVEFGEAGGGRIAEVAGVAIGPNGFGLLGVQPALGRDFVEADAVPGAPRVAVLSDAFWRSRFGGRLDVVGATVALDGEPATVIGVMPPGFAFPSRANLWVPLIPTAEMLERTPAGFMAFGRLAPGTTASQARAELEAINARLARELPATNRDVTPTVGSYSQFFIGPDAATIYGSVWAASWFVLLMACANLANLTLARTVARSRELATRLALGAGYVRLGAELGAQTLLVAVAAGVLGGMLGAAAVDAWAAATDSQYQVLDYGVRASTLAYLSGVAVLAALLVGLAPLTRLHRLGLDGVLQSAARGATRGVGAKRWARMLVAAQMALAIVLLTGTGVLVRSFANVVGADVGVAEPANVLVGYVAVPRTKLPVAEQRAAFFEALRSRVAAVPGVSIASVGNSRPVNVVWQRRFELEGRADHVVEPVSASVLSAGPDYFGAIGAAVLGGREFGIADTAAAPPVAVVNASFAAEHFPGAEAIGQRIRVYDGSAPGEWRQIVGVVSNVMQSEPTRQRFASLVYVPFAQEPEAGAWLFARAETPSDAVTFGVRAAVESFDPDVVLEQYETLEASLRFIADRMDLAHVELGKYAAVAPIFAGIALLLAAVGLYAVVAHAVTLRTKEIGVRVAVGAARRDIRRLVLRGEAIPVGAGVVAGLAASLAVNRVLESQLVGVSPYDPATLVATVAVLTIVALLACLIPARRALRVDPVVALRDD
jgi:putative ABC transport system permease protein